MLLFDTIKPDIRIKVSFYTYDTQKKQSSHEMEFDVNDKTALRKIVRYIESLEGVTKIYLSDVQDSKVLQSFANYIAKPTVEDYVLMFEKLDRLYQRSRMNLLEFFLWVMYNVERYGINSQDELTGVDFSNYYFLYEESAKKENPEIWEQLEEQGVTRKELSPLQNHVLVGQFQIDYVLETGDTEMLVDFDESFVNQKKARYLLWDYIEKNRLPEDVIFTPLRIIDIQNELGVPEICFSTILLGKLGREIEQKYGIHSRRVFYNEKKLIQLVHIE